MNVDSSPFSFGGPWIHIMNGDSVCVISCVFWWGGGEQGQGFYTPCTLVNHFICGFTDSVVPLVFWTNFKEKTHLKKTSLKL